MKFTWALTQHKSYINRPKCATKASLRKAECHICIFSGLSISRAADLKRFCQTCEASCLFKRCTVSSNKSKGQNKCHNVLSRCDWANFDIVLHVAGGSEPGLLHADNHWSSKHGGALVVEIRNLVDAVGPQRYLGMPGIRTFRNPLVDGLR